VANLSQLAVVSALGGDLGSSILGARAAAFRRHRGVIGAARPVFFAA
jgi:hypothetical protein